MKVCDPDLETELTRRAPRVAYFSTHKLVSLFFFDGAAAESSL
jgi:hypothetical protein